MNALLNTLAVSFDLPILDWIQSTMQCAFLDKVMPLITVLGDGGAFWIACAVLMMLLKKYRKAGISAGLALIFGLIICNMYLKPVVARIRPYDFQEQMGVLINLLIEKEHSLSFPSGHTIASFEAATAILLRHKKLGIAAMILAILIAFSRMYLYVHYPTDVIASVFLGIGLAFLASWIVNKVSAAIAAKKAK